jgi:hypothetical protein
MSDHRRIHRTLKKVNIDDANIYDLTNAQVEARLKSAFKAYKAAKKDASMWRDNFLVDLAKAKAKANNTDPELELQSMRRIETQKRMARNVKRMRGKLTRTATTQVYVTENGIRRVATKKLDIEQVCIAKNDSRFSQSEPTPPMTAPLLQDLGYLADGPAIEDILNGVYIPPDGTNYYATHPDKSYWYLIDFTWTGSRWRYRMPAEMPGEITIKNEHGIREDLERVIRSSARKTLGVFIAMDGNSRAQVSYLREKATDFSECIRTGFISRAESWYALKSTIMKTLEYRMEAISLSRKQWDYIMAPILTSTLPKAGFVRTYKRDVLFAPHSSLGMGLRYPYHNQFLKQLLVAVGQIQHATVTSSLLLASAKQLKLEVGFPGVLANIPYDTVGDYMTLTWWKDLLVYLHAHSIRIHDDASQLLANTTDDEFLMPRFIRYGYCKTELRLLNECRMFLQVVTLSDILSMNGTTIKDWAWTGSTARPYSTPLQWPRSPDRLSALHWATWQRALQTSFLGPSGLRVRVCMGLWFPARLEHWDWYYHAPTQRLFHQDAACFTVYTRIPTRIQRLSSYRFQASAVTDYPP